MAILSCGMFQLEAGYKSIKDYSGVLDYEYSFRILINGNPFFSEYIENDLLTGGGYIIASSYEEDRLLLVFKKIIDAETPVGTELSYYCDVDSPQRIFIDVSKETFTNCPNLVYYPIKIRLDSDSYIRIMRIGEITLASHWFDTSEIEKFVREMEGEKEEVSIVQL